MKKPYKIYLAPEDYKKLLAKAGAAGFSGRGAASNYIVKIIKTPIAFLDENVLSILAALKLGPKPA